MEGRITENQTMKWRMGKAFVRRVFWGEGNQRCGAF